MSSNIYDSDRDGNSKEKSENESSQTKSDIGNVKQMSEKSSESICTSKPGDSEEATGENKDGQKQRLLKIQNVKDLILVTATNRPGAIDEALLRPGRIDRIIYVPPPDQDARMEILKVHTRASPVSDDVNLRSIAEKTEMFSGADLENLCREVSHSLNTNTVIPLLSRHTSLNRSLLHGLGIFFHICCGPE